MKNYKELYNEALERAKEHYHAGCFAPAMLEYIFPELEENEDEKIRKGLIEFFSIGANNNETTCNIEDKKILAWLDKQGEKSQDKPANNAEKVEPKFHKDDWVVCEVTGSVYQIKDCIENLSNHKYGYDLTNGDYSSFESAAKSYHLWTIEDAKDGDVLVTKNCNIFIFKSIKGHTVYDYCGLFFGRFESEKGTPNGTGATELPDDYKPATKEQHDLLFAKMKEAGYEWDAEKKELRKVMTIEENLSLKDHCARLPYGVVLHHIPSGENTTLEFIGQGVIDGDIHDVIENFKPYLRRMSSMTEEEREEYDTWHEELEEGRIKDWKCAEFIDWLNSHFLDYQDLIDKGLALEAPEGMYNQK